MGVGLEILLLRLQGTVRCVEGHVAEEGCVVVGMAADEVRGRIGDQVGRITLVVIRPIIAVPVEFAFPFMGEIVDVPVVVADELGEAAAQGMILHIAVAQVPLAEDAAMFVAGLGEDLR